MNNNQKATKRALLTSVMALVMCVVMLVGTTFAWFTDTASTGVNKIQAGTLDVALEMKDASGNWVNAEGETLTWKKAANAPANEQILWEPGCTYELPQLRVVNKGNLALKYKVIINGIKGDAKLNEVIDWTINDAAIDLTEKHLLAGQTDVPFTIKGQMQETAGNEYQGLTIDGIGITVVATQAASEFDSFNSIYDTDATYLNTDADGNYLISNANELVYFAKTVNVDRETYAGKTVKLTADIDLAGKKWVPIGNLVDYPTVTFSGTFDGQGHTISNMNVVDNTVNHAVAGFFGSTGGATIQDVIFKDAVVKSTHYAGVVVAYEGANNSLTHVKNVVVDGAAITSSAELINGAWDNGDKVGGIVGYATSIAVDNCTVKNSTITGYRDLGGIGGCLDGTYHSSVTKCTVNNVTIAVDNTHNYKNFTSISQHNVNDFIGRNLHNVTATDNTATNCVVGRTVYGLAIIPNGENSKIIVNSKEGLLNLTKLFNDWTTLFTDGNGNEYGNYYNGAGTDYYYSSYWTISLEADIDLNNATIAPIALNFPTSTGPVKFEGNAKTISHANIVTDANTENAAGLFDARNVVMNNLKLDSIRVTGSNVHNSTAGVLSGITNCDVTNITITNSSVTGGKYTGGVVGYGYNSVKNCSLTNVTVKGGYKLGGLIGYICASGTNTSNVTDNILTNCTVDGIGGDIFADGKNVYIIGKVVGNYNCNGICNNNTITNMTTSATANIGKIESGKTVTQ